MKTENGIKGTIRTLALPAVVSAAGGAIGLFLSRKPEQLRRAITQLPDVDVGGIKDDLRGRIDSVLGNDDSESGERSEAPGEQSEAPGEQSVDADKLEDRRSERQKRREERKQRLGA